MYYSKKLEDAVGRLRYAADNELFTVVMSEPGCGKSTLIRMFDHSIPKERYTLLYLSDSKLTPRWLYAGLLDQLGLESRFYRGDSKRNLQRAIEQTKVAHKKVVCVLDEAHLLERLDSAEMVSYIAAHMVRFVAEHEMLRTMEQ